MVVPVLYFGSQLAAAPFYPGYSFITNSASQLGSDRSQWPAILNTGAILTGVASLLSAPGFVVGLTGAGGRRVWAVACGLCVASTGAAAIWAGSFPMPDPRHNPGALGAGTFLAPIVLLLAVWRIPGARWLRVYLLVTLAVFAGLIPIMSGMTPVDLARFGGLMQRVGTLVLYFPPAVVAAYLLRRMP